MKKLIVVVLIMVSFLGFSQAPLVPKTMKFADLDLHISNSARAQIQKSVNSLHKSPTYFNKMREQADIFFPIIEAEFKKTNFPDDIKYLCIQESAFVSDAVSSSNAVGYWQFKEATAIEQGLDVDRVVDERKNIVSASEAAAKYMTAHNSKLDNWAYAVVAYNTGLGGVKKYYKKSYAGVSKMHITKDTHWYFLKLLAHKIAFEGFVGREKPTTVLKVYEKTGGKTIKQYAKQHNIELKKVAFYNTWINENKTIPEGENYPVVIPMTSGMETIADKGQDVKKDKTKEGKHKTKKDRHKTKGETANTPTVVKTNHKKESVAIKIEETQSKNIRYTVNRVPAITAIEGDNSAELALKGGITKDKFLKYNEIKSFEELIVGQTYFLKKKKRKSRSKHYVAQHGETLWSISQKFGVRKTSLRTKNRMSKTEALQPGRLLWLKILRPEEKGVEYREVEKPKPVKVIKKKPVVETPKEVVKDIPVKVIPKVQREDSLVNGRKAKYIHKVQSQETLFMISHYYLVAVDSIKAWNELTGNDLSIGQKLYIVDSERNLNIIKDTSKVQEIIPHTDRIVPVEEVEEVVLEEKKVVKPVVEGHRVATRFRDIWVEPGSTLYGLSREYDVSVDDIKKYNVKALSDGLNAGEKLVLPVYDNETDRVTPTKIYIVVAGDTYYSISKKTGVSVELLKEKNNKKDNSLTVGEKLSY